MCINTLHNEILIVSLNSTQVNSRRSNKLVLKLKMKLREDTFTPDVDSHINQNNSNLSSINFTILPVPSNDVRPNQLE